MNNSEKLIETIRKQHVKPIPRRHFWLKNAFIWLVFICSVIFGALAFSVILFSVQQLDFSLFTHMSHSWFEFLLGLLPFFWIIALVICLIIAIFSIKNSKKGYKFSSSSLLGFSVAFSILLGTLFFISGGAKWLENAFAIRVSLYESIQEKKMKIWMAPGEGYLSGTVEKVYNDSITFIDFKNNMWSVSTREADISPNLLLESGAELKLIGKMTGDGKFRANAIRPWGGAKRLNEMIKK